MIYLNNNTSKQRGLTLVELMVALIISLLLMAGILQIFISNKKTYRVNEGISRLQENGRFALEFLSRDIRMADYTGCSANVPVTNTLNCPDNPDGSTPTRSADGKCDNDIVYDLNIGVAGFNNITGTLPASLGSSNIDPIVGSDVLVIRRNSDNGVRIVQNNNGAQVFVENTGTTVNGCGPGIDSLSGICNGDTLIISDCSKSRIFQAGNVTAVAAGGGSVAGLNITHPASGDPGNAITSWGGNSAPDNERFSDDAELTKIETYTYYVATGSNGYPSLFRKVGSAVGTELVEGIQNIQIEYGEDRNNDSITAATTYVDADNVNDWENVVSIRVNLLVSSGQDFITENNQTFTFYDGTFTATDNRLYKPFTSTISVRNRLR